MQKLSEHEHQWFNTLGKPVVKENNPGEQKRFLKENKTEK